MACCQAPDYLDDFVRSHLINTCALIAAGSPFNHWMYLILFTFDAIAQQPLFYFFFYMVLSLVIYLVIVIPLQIGNKISSKTSHIIFSILYCCLLLAYNIYYGHSFLHEAAAFNVSAIIQLIWISTSCLAVIAIIIQYICIVISHKYHHCTSINHPYFARKYTKLERLQQSTETADCVQNQQDREIRKGYKYLIKQFLCPSVDHIDEDKLHCHNEYICIYPSRLFVATYIAFIGIISAFLANVRIFNVIEDSLTELKHNLDSNGANSPISSLLRTLYTFGHCFNEGFIISIVIGLLFGLYGIIVAFPAWRKKMINMQRNAVTFRYEADMFPMWYTTKFMVSFASYLITGSVCITYIFAIVIGLLLYPPFWSYLLSGWQYFAGYLGYQFIEYFIIRRCIHSKIDLLQRYENVFNVVLVVSDFMYLPLALAAGVLRILLWLCIALFSYVRPDINIYPRGLEDFDMGHLTFVASVRLLLERRDRYIEKYHDVQAQFDSNALGPSDSAFDAVAASDANPNYHSLATAQSIVAIENDAVLLK